MLSRCRRLALDAACLGIGLLLPAAAPGASDRMRELIAQVRTESLAHPERAAAALPQAFGTGETVVNIDTYAFQGAQSAGDVLSDDGNGYRFLVSTTSGGYLAAPVQIPSGARIENMGVNFCVGATGALTVGLFDGNANGQPISLIGGFTTISQSGCFETAAPVGYEYSINYQHPLYATVHWEGPLDGSLKFNAVWVSYKLVVSPAPATATFADVPTDNPLFQYVEALVASGITAGCGNGNYCPNAPLTRGQMAVFLSKALGLDWPY